MNEFDPSLYARAPKFTLAGGITLARTLVDGCPNSMPNATIEARDKLGQIADKAEERLAMEQRKAISDSDTRGLDGIADGSWSSLRGRITSYAGLPVDQYPLAARAAELDEQLFGSDGLGFVKMSYPVQSATAATILKRIDEDGLQPDIDRIAGPEFLAHVRTTQMKYARMVKDVLQVGNAAKTDIQAHIRALQRGITRLALSICGTVDDDEPETVSRARKILQPIDSLRMANSRRRRANAANASDTPNDAPTDEVPTDEAPGDEAPAETPVDEAPAAETE